MDNEILKSMRDLLREELQPIKNNIKELTDGQKRLETKVDNLEMKVDNLETKVDNLEVKVDNLEKGQEEIKALIQELDPKNAQRHLELKESINELRKDLTNVEIITSSNWNEIAKLKKIK